jgi:hypothetical protein
MVPGTGLRLMVAVAGFQPASLLRRLILSQLSLAISPHGHVLTIFISNASHHLRSSFF